MNDNILSTVTGSVTSVLAMITGIIRVETLLEVIFYGFVGGVVGYLGKWVVQVIRYKIEKRYMRNESK
jgi:hypothetical protein